MKLLSTFLVTVIFTCLSIAQEPRLNLTNFTTVEGLPSSEVYHTMQDSKGFIWVCTDNGVSRYNGTIFENFGLEDGITDLTVFRSFEDEKGRIWFSTFSKKLCYFEDEKIKPYPWNKNIQKFIKEHPEKDLEVGVPHDFFVINDTIYLGIQKRSPLVISPIGEVTLFKKNSGENYFQKISNNSWISYFQKKKQNTQQLDQIKLLINSPKILQFKLQQSRPLYYAEKQSDIVIGFSKYLYLCKKDTLIQSNTLDHLSTSTYITWVFIDNENGLWVGTLNNGMYYYSSFLNLEDKPKHYLGQNTISCIQQDQEGGMWYSTTENGIFYSPNPHVLNFANLKEEYSESISVLTQHNEELIIGYDNGTIETKKENSYRYFKHFDEKRSTPIYTIYPLKERQNLISSNYFCLYENDTLFYSRKEKLTATKCFYKTSKGNILAGTPGQLIELNLDQLKHNNQPFYEIIHKKRILSICEDKNGIIWLGARDGIYQLKENYKLKKVKLFSTISTSITNIQPWKNGVVFCSVEGDVVLFNDGKIIRIKQLKGNKLNTIWVENEHEIWIGGNKGLFKINYIHQKKINFEFYNQNSGLSSNEINSILLKKDTLWIGTTKGLNAIPLSLNKPRTYPKIEINQFTVLDKPISKTSLEKLKPSENFIKIFFESKNFRFAKEVSYKYRMKAWGDKWIETKANFISFSDLQPGHYSFEVKAVYPNFQESNVPAQLSFTILPPIWKRWWFILISIACILSILFIYFKLRIKRLNEKFKLETSMLEAKNQTLIEEQKALRAQMNPHFIFNGLNSIYHLLLTKETDKAIKTITKFSGLIRSILNSSREEYISLDEEIEMLKNYMELQKLQLQDGFDFSISVKDEVLEEDLMLPSMIIQPFLENAVIHGIIPLKARRGKISLSIEMIDDYTIKCIVKDNGVGRQKEHTTKKATHKSVGIEATGDRLKNLLPDFGSPLITYIDEIEGTTVKIILPVK